MSRNRGSESLNERTRDVATFLALVIALTWPLMLFGRSYEDPWAFNALSMIAVALVALMHARISNRSLGLIYSSSPVVLVIAFLLPFAMYLPTIIAFEFGYSLAVLLQALLNFIPSLGEEVGWRAYFYGKLLEKYSEGKRLLIHGVVWYLWHLPAFSSLQPYDLLAFVLVLPLGVLHATLFVWFYCNGGLFASALYHTTYNTLRDASLVFGRTTVESTAYSLITMVRSEFWQPFTS